MFLSVGFQYPSKEDGQIYLRKIPFSFEIELCLFSVELRTSNGRCGDSYGFDAPWDGISSWFNMGTLGDAQLFDLE